VELPPVRSWPTHSPQEPQLPSLSSLAPGPPSFPTPRRPSVSLPMPSAQYGMWQPSKGQASSQGTLLTAPNSPEIHQHRHHQRTHSFPTPTQDSHQLNYQYRNHGYSASPQDGERRPSSKDSRMNLSSLLG
jgi:hypothetical protein